MALAVSCSPCLAQASKPSDEPPAPAVEYNPKAWKEFSSAGGRFTVLLPGTPTEKIQSRDSPAGTLDVHEFILITSAYYGVTYIEYPSSIEGGGDVKAFLDGMIGAGVKGIGGTLLEEEDTPLDGHPGRFVRVQAGDGYVMRIRSYVVGNRIYQISITMREAGAPQAIARFHDETAAKFLDSFRLVSGVADTEHRVVKGYAGEGGGVAAPAERTEGEVDRLLKSLREKGEPVFTLCSDPATCQPSTASSGAAAADKALSIHVIDRPQPDYPPVAKAARAQGTVIVQVVVDEEGRVMAAQALSGHPLLQASAVKAARGMRVSPILVGGKPVKFVGTVSYNFALK
jgi:TonB family protein